MKSSNSTMLDSDKKQKENQKKYSNIIFTPHRRSYSLHPKSHNKQRNCSDKKIYSISNDNHQVLEVSQDHKMNVINLLKGNHTVKPRVKSHYCKKITLLNLDKYYQYCVNNVQSFTGISFGLKPGELTRAVKISQLERRTCNTSESSRKNAFYSEIKQEPPIKKEKQTKQQMSEQFISAKVNQKNQIMKRIPHRPIYRHNLREPNRKGSKRYEAMRKDEFKLEGWEIPDFQQDIL